MRQSSSATMMITLWVLFGFTVTARLVPAVTWRHYVPKAPGQNVADLVRMDPHLPYPVPKGTLADAIRGRPAIIMAVGDCTACARQHVRQLELAAVPASTARIALVFGSPGQSGFAEMAREFRRVRILSGGSDLKSALNASFNPRLYAIDTQGRLIWMQSPLDATAASIYEAQRSIEHAKNTKA